jgi:hypothetical protein
MVILSFKKAGSLSIVWLHYTSDPARISYLKRGSANPLAMLLENPAYAE